MMSAYISLCPPAQQYASAYYSFSVAANIRPNNAESLMLIGSKCLTPISMMPIINNSAPVSISSMFAPFTRCGQCGCRLWARHSTRSGTGQSADLSEFRRLLLRDGPTEGGPRGGGQCRPDERSDAAAERRKLILYCEVSEFIELIYFHHSIWRCWSPYSSAYRWNTLLARKNHRGRRQSAVKNWSTTKTSANSWCSLSTVYLESVSSFTHIYERKY